MASIDVVADALERLEDAGVDAARGADARALAAWARGDARRRDGDDDARVALARACARAMLRAGRASADADALEDGARAGASRAELPVSLRGATRTVRDETFFVQDWKALRLAQARARPCPAGHL